MLNKTFKISSFLHIRTTFGRESEVVAHTFLNSHKAEKKENHWVVISYAGGETKRHSENESTQG